MRLSTKVQFNRLNSELHAKRKRVADTKGNTIPPKPRRPRRPSGRGKSRKSNFNPRFEPKRIEWKDFHTIPSKICVDESNSVGSLTVTSPFEELPVEIRILIYNYLVPNVESTTPFGSPQRHEGPCYPVILSLNHFLRAEVLPEWHPVDVPYEARIEGSYSVRTLRIPEFLSPLFQLTSPIPPAFIFLKNLFISHRLDSTDWSGVLSPNVKNNFARMFPPVPIMPRLEHFKISITTLHPRYYGNRGTQAELQQLLQETLSPLRNITGVKHAEMEFVLEYLETGVPKSQAFILSGKVLCKAIKDFFLNLIHTQIEPHET